MIDVTKLREKGDLAKQLVEKGLAPDIQTALNQIEKQGMVNSKQEDFLRDASTSEPEVEIKSMEESPASPPQEEQKVETKEIDPEFMQKIAQLTQKVDQINDFFSKYQQQNDNNLREVDQRLRSIENRLKEAQNVVSNTSNPSVQENKSEPVPEKSNEDDNQRVPKGMDPSEFSVDKIFNNSNGQMEKRNN